MSEETRKEYTIIGKVEIGTDEYRDLIEAVRDAQAEAKEQNEKRWEYWRKADELEKEVEELTLYKEYVIGNCETEFKLWKVEENK